ncbi:hypothetical protein OIK40_14450 [Erythrobacter sp. sf7]|uniref:Uncharacterized protein n=1 Tax=Erythrobacter fulvus TaxID=2987523 RepID=A0ABT5JUV7_9SPHN|nr:hypothetical protein [Erythrobacter fulvus]MDC8755846.1 hypothetical protein [Erythrobacter fulvus]
MGDLFMNVLSAILLLAQSVNPLSSGGSQPLTFEEFVEKAEPERLGAGPYTLVIVISGAFIRFDYASGEKCLHARNEVRRQAELRAFCIPT